MTAAIPCEYVSWNRFYRLAQNLTRRILLSGYRPDLLVAVARGGYPLARVLSDHLDIMDLADFKIKHYRRAHKDKRAMVRYPLTWSSPPAGCR